MRLRVAFSPLHPFFRPAVAAPEETFGRHQNPLTKDLCLLTQETGQWNSCQLTADFIQERLEQLLAVTAARHEERWEEAAALEEQAPDPLMPYFSHASEDDSVVLFDGGVAIPREGHGLLELVLSNRSTRRNDLAFEGVLQQVKSSSGGMLGRRFSFPQIGPNPPTVTGRWVRFSPPPTDDPTELLRLAEEELTRQSVLQPKSVQKVNSTASAPFSITGIVFPDEAEYGQGKAGAGWLFLVTRRAFVNGKLGAAETKLVRGQRAGREDTFSRLPVASSLSNKKVLVVGCGAIGSFAGVEIARAGVGAVMFFDSDTVEPGNSLRWPLGRQAWGVEKASALADFVSRNYPWTKASAYVGRLGTAITDVTGLPADLSRNPSILSQVLAIIGEVDLVVDTAASTEVQHALAYHCRKMNIPYVMGYATLGVAGGVIARFIPNSESCWVCLHEHWKDRTLPSPRVNDAGFVVPVGCNAPTFTGGGFDLQEISLEVVRSAVGLLSGGIYDPGSWPLAILELQDAEGKRVLPRWEAHDCPPHPRCCGAR